VLRVVTFKMEEQDLGVLDRIILDLSSTFNIKITRSEIIRAAILNFIEEYHRDPLIAIKKFLSSVFPYRPLFKPYNRNRG